MANDVFSLLRAAKRADHDAFEDAIRAYLKRGDKAIEGKPVGAPKRISRVVYAMLLADVMNRPEGMSKAAKRRELAKKGLKWGNGDGQVFWWFNANTIKTHLTAAETLADEDSEFAEDVEFYRWAFRVINL